jgi:hypothetical protein
MILFITNLLYLLNKCVTDKTPQHHNFLFASSFSCKCLHFGATVVTLVVVLLLPHSLAMDDGKFDHGGGSGGSNGLVAAAVVVAVNDRDH